MSELDQTVAGPVGFGGPATLQKAKDRLPVNQAVVDLELQDVVDAVNALIHERWHPPVVDGVARVWSKNHVLGGNMLASRLYTRRNSPAGVLMPNGDGAASYVQRNDPDVALLLGIGQHAKPAVG